MFPQLRFEIIYLALVSLVPTLAASVPTVDLGYVTYTGFSNTTSGLNYFYGIPYAQAPSGDLRWRKPRPIEEKNNFGGLTRSAVEHAPPCYQGGPLPLEALLKPYFVGNMSEDCLILDVVAPISPVSSSLPVIVQIHGGGYTVGSSQTNPGDGLVHDSAGKIIHVAIQYRLGALGFLSSGQVQGDGVANAGLLDQRAALDWVQRNIAKFGGDPSKVTIWGGSAGGGSVAYQLIAGGAFDNPPFSGAIAEYPWWQPMANASSQELQYNTILDLANCTNIACLRNLTAAELQDAYLLSYNVSYPGPDYGYGIFYYGPVVDGKFIRQRPDLEYKAGNVYDVPILVDHDAYEGVIFSNTSLTSQVAETTDAGDLFPNAGPSFFSRMYQLYPMSGFNSTFFQRQTWFGDFIINCPTYIMGTSTIDHAQNSSAVFKLIFSAGSELHGATASFLSSADTSFPAANNQTIREMMTSYWISFTVTGDPNPLRSSVAPFWPSYNSGGAGNVTNGESVGFQTLSITYTTAVAEGDPDVSGRCDFFSSQGYVLSN